MLGVFIGNSVFTFGKALLLNLDVISRKGECKFELVDQI